MKALFIATTCLTVLLGVGWLFFPEAMLASWSVKGDPVAVYMGRRYGGLQFGYATLLWLTRAAPPSSTRTAILAGGMVVTGVMAVVSLWGALSGVVGAGVWGAVVVEALLAAGFGYFLVTSR